jgi:ectoine hydroxylase-related dioxygenase (phytanoyl-CoA dioxygenase family)
MHTYDFTVSADQPASDVERNIRKFGIAHIPGYLDQENAAAAAKQARRLLDTRASWITPLEYSIGKSIRAESSNLAVADGFSKLSNAFTTEYLRVIADQFMCGREYKFHHDLYVAYDIQGTHHFAHTLHYDRIPHLKFFLYLTDVTSDNGPLMCVPGSHHFAPQVQANNRRDGIIPTEQETRRIPAHYANQGIHVLGHSGTVLAFTSDIIHSATKIVFGERLVARNRCIEPRYLEAVRRTKEAAKSS